MNDILLTTTNCQLHHHFSVSISAVKRRKISEIRMYITKLEIRVQKWQTAHCSIPHPASIQLIKLFGT